MRISVVLTCLLNICSTAVFAAPTKDKIHSLNTQLSLDHTYQEPISDQTIYSNSPFRIPTRHESTILARRLLALSHTGTLSTIFPHKLNSPYIPHDVHDTPIGLPDYVASCEEPTGNPTILALTISTSTRNAVAGSNVSLALSWWDEYVHLTHKQPWSAASLPRMSLVGYLEEMSQEEVEQNNIVECYLKSHADAKLWLPGDKGAAHRGVWMRMVVQEVYWIGGFGDRAFIGWFDVEDWRAIGVEEWSKVRLPGEKTD